jgi:hypothetical protein
MIITCCFDYLFQGSSKALRNNFKEGINAKSEHFCACASTLEIEDNEYYFKCWIVSKIKFKMKSYRHKN